MPLSRLGLILVCGIPLAAFIFINFQQPDDRELRSFDHANLIEKKSGRYDSPRSNSRRSITIRHSSSDFRNEFNTFIGKPGESLSEGNLQKLEQVCRQWFSRSPEEAIHAISEINPLSPPAAPVQGRLQGPPAKSKFLAVTGSNSPSFDRAKRQQEALKSMYGAALNYAFDGGGLPVE
jgi:hypothetical protein